MLPRWNWPEVRGRLAVSQISDDVRRFCRFVFDSTTRNWSERNPIAVKQTQTLARAVSHLFGEHNVALANREMCRLRIEMPDVHIDALGYPSFPHTIHVERCAGSRTVYPDLIQADDVTAEHKFDERSVHRLARRC